MHTSALEARIFPRCCQTPGQRRVPLTQASANISNVTWRKRMIGKAFAMTEGAACSEGWIVLVCSRFSRSSSPFFSLSFPLPHLGKLLQAPGREQRRAVKASAERNE